jgi:hypothetical protein
MGAWGLRPPLAPLQRTPSYFPLVAWSAPVLMASTVTVFTPGKCTIEGTSISIEEFLKVRLLHNALEGPLSDCEAEDDDAGSHSNAGGPTFPRNAGYTRDEPRVTPLTLPNSSHLTMEEKRRRMYKVRRKLNRTRKQVDGKTGQKQVQLRRGSQATVDSFVLSSDVASTDRVSKQGWIGRPLGHLPKGVFTREVLVNEHGMSYFDWDGMWVHLLHLRL